MSDGADKEETKEGTWMKQWTECLAFVSQLFEEMSVQKGEVRWGVGSQESKPVQQRHADRRGWMQPSEGCKTFCDGDNISEVRMDRSRGGKSSEHHVGILA